MRLFQPASRYRDFNHVQTINRRPKLWSAMAPSRNYSSSIERVKVTPWARSAPRNNDATSFVSTTEALTRRKAYIALGSNLGDRIRMIEDACNEMSSRGIKVMRTSSLWETEPMYVLEQDNFVNGACEVGLVSLVFSIFLSFLLRLLCTPQGRICIRKFPFWRMLHLSGDFSKYSLLKN